MDREIVGEDAGASLGSPDLRRQRRRCVRTFRDRGEQPEIDGGHHRRGLMI